MATPSADYPHYERWSLDNLSTELIILILNHLCSVDVGSLSAVRLVSTRFNAIATPMRYHTIRMTQPIINPKAEDYFPQGIANIYAHTAHVKVDSDLNAEDVKRLLDKIVKLSSISWRYVQDDLCKGDVWLPSDIIPPRHIESNKIQLYIENLPLRDFRFEQQNPYLKAIPTGILKSLKMAIPTPLLTARVGSLKDLLLNSRQLDTFWYEDRGQGTQFEFNGSERLPPFQDLSLRSYDWNHDALAARQHWDFAKIRRLELVNVSVSRFLNSVSFADFQDLEILRLDDYSPQLSNTQLDATRSQYALIKQIRALTDLRITCHTQSFPIDGILHHAQSLQNLRFRDYTGFADEQRRCPTMNIEDLAGLSRALVNLRTLELDMDERRCEPHRFLPILASFRQLHTLTLHTQTVLDPVRDTIVASGRDLDCERAMYFFSLVQDNKQGAPWRSVTINVGNWKPIMVRRLSAPWRRQNSRGLYAERCFVMERRQDDDGNGAVTVREELPIETS
ncbi:F-box domain-containing protein [Nemania sp. FL0916]|nr:F-box domain-containing protein [Nemania sp. FL0916]